MSFACRKASCLVDLDIIARTDASLYGVVYTLFSPYSDTYPSLRRYHSTTYGERPVVRHTGYTIEIIKLRLRPR